MADPPAEWVLASHNAGKVREIQELFAGLPVVLRVAADLKLPEPEVHDNSTFPARSPLRRVRSDTGRLMSQASAPHASGLPISASPRTLKLRQFPAVVCTARRWVT